MLCFTTLLISHKTVHSVDGRMTDKRCLGEDFVENVFVLMEQLS